MLKEESYAHSITVRECNHAIDRDTAMNIRFTVFVNEQNVPANLEADEFDANALHLLAEDGNTGEAIGVARILNKGNGVAKIGRVAVLLQYRGRGIGKVLMEDAIRRIRERGFERIILDAQIQVVLFYERLGFIPEGDIFEDAGIPHRHMTLSLIAR